MMPQGFYYLHITTTVQSDYPGSHYKFLKDIFVSKLFIIYFFTQHFFFTQRFLFRAKIHADLFLSVSCVSKLKIKLPLYNDYQFWPLYTGLFYNDHLPITTTETSSHKWSLYTGLTVLF